MSDYKDMLSPDNLRALADGVANQNAEAERVSRLYAASESMREALAGLVRADRCHFFQPRGHETWEDRNTCTKCGSNLREAIHLRAHESDRAAVMRKALAMADAALAAAEGRS